MNYSIIVCIHEESGGIGKNNNLLFRLKDEMKYFKDTTTKTKNENNQNAVIMGYNTWKSIPSKFRPLDNRINIIISHNHYDNVVSEIVNIDNTYVFKTINECVEFTKTSNNIETSFIIGGESIYKTFIDMNIVDTYYITKIMNQIEYNCDSFFPKIKYEELKKISNNILKSEKDSLEIVTKEKKEVFYKFCVYQKI